MDRNEIMAGFDELIGDIKEETHDGAQHEYLGFIAQEQMRAGFFPEAMRNLDMAATMMLGWKRQLTDTFDLSKLPKALDHTGPTIEEIQVDNWKLSVLAMGHAKAGKITEAIGFAKQIHSDEERQKVLRRVLGTAQNDSDRKSVMQTFGSELASSLRRAAELAEIGKLEEALAIFGTIDQKAKCFAEAKENSHEDIFERRAIVLADAALKLRAESGDKLPADFAKKPVPGAQADGAKNKGTRG